MILNSHVGPVRMQMTNNQNMNKSDISKKDTLNLNVCYSDESQSKRINAGKTLSHICYTDKSKPKSVIVNAYSSDESESKGVI